MNTISGKMIITVVMKDATLDDVSGLFDEVSVCFEERIDAERPTLDDIKWQLVDEGRWGFNNVEFDIVDLLTVDVEEEDEDEDEEEVSYVSIIRNFVKNQFPDHPLDTPISGQELREAMEREIKSYKE